MMNRGGGSLPIGVCKLSETSGIEECCVDFFLQDGKCVVCPPGRIGYACAEDCPHNYYGLSCRNPCICLSYQVCDPVSGCCEPPCTQSTSPQGDWVDYAMRNEPRFPSNGQPSEDSDDFIQIVRQYGAYVPAVLGFIALILLIIACKKIYDRSKGSSIQDAENVDGRNAGYTVPLALHYDQLQGDGNEAQSILSFSSSTVDENADVRKDDGYEEPADECDDRRNGDGYGTPDDRNDESTRYEKPVIENTPDSKDYKSRYEILQRKNETRTNEREESSSNDNRVSSQNGGSFTDSDHSESDYSESGKIKRNEYEVSLREKYERLTQVPKADVNDSYMSME